MKLMSVILFIAVAGFSEDYSDCKGPDGELSILNKNLKTHAALRNTLDELSRDIKDFSLSEEELYKIEGEKLKYLQNLDLSKINIQEVMFEYIKENPDAYLPPLIETFPDELKWADFISAKIKQSHNANDVKVVSRILKNLNSEERSIDFKTIIRTQLYEKYKGYELAKGISFWKKGFYRPLEYLSLGALYGDIRAFMLSRDIVQKYWKNPSDEEMYEEAILSVKLFSSNPEEKWHKESKEKLLEDIEKYNNTISPLKK